ncbi:signal recognition particle receptor subunit beta [Episyrphus balteatus]|uniref:signal recognition particle receptor subunit beta n=1 Tax=Episyrphus balteatus TaxID=286459 RepID=UPI00248636A4|nr:signal recognition particle receptor subunit beta [Episyrphus balteatus]
MDRINEKSNGNDAIEQEAGDISQILIALIAGLIILVIFFIYKSRSSSRRHFILTGLCDSGKSVVFTQLLYSKVPETFTSIAENVGTYQAGRLSAPLVDIPGHERVRDKFFDQYKNTTKGVIFLVDSVTIQKDVRDVADFLYTILSDPAISPCSILILCNKQDEEMAKSAQVIKTLLEKEMNTVRKTRTSKLQSVDDSENKVVFLGKEGKDFEFSHLSQNVQFYEGSGKNNDLANLSDWIDRML